MNNLKPILSTLVLSLSFYLIGCSDNSKESKTHSIFATKTEAEKTAKDFNCTGAHRMGEKWMPCQSHTDHEEAGKDESHEGNHHHHH